MKKHSEPLLFTTITLVSNLLPIIFSLLFYAANPKKWEGFEIFYNQGQFYLYVASFLTSSAYIFYTFKVLNTDRNSVLLLITSLLILVSSTLYVLNLVGLNNDNIFLFRSSGILFALTLCLYYFANYQNSIKVDVIGAQRAGINEIMKNL